MISPKLPDFDLATWKAEPWHVRLKMICQAWAADGYGTPLALYLLYALKIGGYIGAWLFFCTFTTGYGLDNLGAWWSSDQAFLKAILWTTLFEGLGLGCGSGPLTARYVPPVGGALYFLRPGTTKLPLIEGLPIVGGHRRTLLDVALYAATLGVLLWGLTAANVTAVHLIPYVALVPLMALGDKTLFLVFRAEHYLSVCLAWLLASRHAEKIASAKVVWMAIWWWAATSKLNVHFPAVMGVMTSNAPITRGTPLRRLVYRSFPDDLRPSRFAAAMAHFGTVFEYLIPALLLLSDGGPVTTAALVGITVFHLFILFNVPMGVPLEWNVIMIYGAWVLFGTHAEVAAWTIEGPALWAWLLGFHLVLPLYGSQYPHRVSFLLAMRYYAGNWAHSTWLFRGDAITKLDQLTKWSPTPRAQLRLLYDDDTVDALLAKVGAFRRMHILGRVLNRVWPHATDDPEAVEWVDGEVIAGMVVGWNFGEGHLHDEQLLRAVQAQCGFAPGELRIITCESQPIFTPSCQWRVTDAATGELARGTVAMDELAREHPWPLSSDPAAMAS